MRVEMFECVIEKGDKYFEQRISITFLYTPEKNAEEKVLFFSMTMRQSSGACNGKMHVHLAQR
jgi:hypothetical protein